MGGFGINLGVGDVLGTLMSPFTARQRENAEARNIQRQMEANKELMGVQFEQSKEMAQFQNNINVENWERENAYNNPLEQKRRLEAAGYNTAALEGSLSGASSSVASNSGSISGSIPGMNFDTESAKANAMSNMISAGSKVFDSYVNSKLAESKLLSDEVKRELDVKKTETETILQSVYGEQGSLYAAQANEIRELTPERKAQLQAVTANTQKEFDLIVENIAGAQTSRRLTEKNIDKIPFEINKLIAEEGELISRSVQQYSQVSVNKTLAALNLKDAELKSAQTALQYLYGDAQKFQNWFNEQTKDEQLSRHTYETLQARKKYDILSTDSQYRAQLHENTITVGDAVKFSLYGNTAVNMFEAATDTLFRVFGSSNNVKDSDQVNFGGQILDGAACRSLMKLAEQGFGDKLAQFGAEALMF